MSALRPATPTVQTVQGATSPRGGAIAPKKRARLNLSSTPQVFRFARVVIVITLIVAGAVSFFSLTLRSTSLHNTSNTALQALRLEALKAEILYADGVARNGMAQGSSEPPSHHKEYRSRLSSATKLLVDASTEDLNDRRALSEVNAALSDYSLSISTARTVSATDTSRSKELLEESTTILTSRIIPVLNSRIEAHRKTVESSTSEQMWSTLLIVAIPPLLMVAVGIHLAKRTRRIVNIGLTIAFLATTSTFFIDAKELRIANSLVSNTKTSILHDALTTSEAISHLTLAKSIEGQQFTQPTKVNQLESEWQESMGVVKKAVSHLDTFDDRKTTVFRYADSHARALSAIRTNDAAKISQFSGDTLDTGVNATFAKAVSSLQDNLDETRTIATTDLAEQSKKMRSSRLYVLGLNVLGAMAAILGLGSRIREYR